jgi:GH15 family glucan-1,4-alpha-glucosidase
MYRPIGDYAVIGDCQTAALISSEGSIDWLCLPRFDSPAIFLRLLDDKRGGYCALKVAELVSAQRQYLAGTNVLETAFQTRSGKLVLTDFMAVRFLPDLNETGQDLTGEHRLIRLMRCAGGEVESELEIKPTFDYANGHKIESAADGRNTVVAVSRNGLAALQLQLLSSEPQRHEGFQIEADGRITARVDLRAGQTAAVVMTFSEPPQRVALSDLNEVGTALARTRQCWENWSKALNYDGEYRDLVLRSALALKLMIYEATGAIVAAPTTSLPEAIGGERNWDYRFTWLRDATFTLIALMNLGYFGEARDFLHFLKRTARGSDRFQVLYPIEGGTDVEEHELKHLDGYAGSRPVRVGNAARHQRQLDIYGEMIHCIYLYAAHPETKLHPDSFRAEFWELIRKAANYVVHNWRLPDSGIWEMRGKPRQFVYSKGTCWLALDRAIRLAQESGLESNADVRRWRRERDQLREDFLSRGFNPKVGAFVQSYSSRELDASILRLPMMGVIPATDPKMLATVAQIERQLMKNGLVYRYQSDDTLHGQEAAFAACSFWLVDNYVLAGRAGKAHDLFQHLVSFANDVGLLAEEIDPNSGAQLGNFPQAFTHIALINSALRLSAARDHHKPTTHVVAEEDVHLPFKKAA